MSTVIDTVFENGVFRPLKPVAIPENQPVKIRLEDGMGEGLLPVYPRVSPSQYPEDFPDVSEADRDYLSVPPKSVSMVRAQVTFVGKRQPAPYPED